MKLETLEAIATDPKIFLLKGRNVKALIASKRERIAEWRRLAESITVTLKEGGTSGGGYKQSIVENAVTNIVDLENEILEEIAELVCVERAIREAINVLISDSRYAAILELRYVHHLKLEEIAVRLNYAFRWVQRLHGQALLEMKEAALSRAALVL